MQACIYFTRPLKDNKSPVYTVVKRIRYHNDLNLSLALICGWVIYYASNSLNWLREHFVWDRIQPRIAFSFLLPVICCYLHYILLIIIIITIYLFFNCSLLSGFPKEFWYEFFRDVKSIGKTLQPMADTSNMYCFIFKTFDSNFSVKEMILLSRLPPPL